MLTTPRDARQIPAAATRAPMLPHSQRKIHTRGNIYSCTVGWHPGMGLRNRPCSRSVFRVLYSRLVFQLPTALSRGMLTTPWGWQGAPYLLSLLIILYITAHAPRSAFRFHVSFSRFGFKFRYPVVRSRVRHTVEFLLVGLGGGKWCILIEWRRLLPAMTPAFIRLGSCPTYYGIQNISYGIL